MNKKRKQAAAKRGQRPIHVTEWGDVFVRDGVLYAYVRSGPDEMLFSMGPRKALEAVELAKRALASADVLPMMPPGQH